MRKGQNIYRRKDGRWEGRCYLKSSRKYKSVYGHSYTEVKEKLKHVSAKDCVPAKICNLPFAEIMSLWLKNKKTIIKITSYYCYKNKLDNHILPYFSGKLYSALTKADLERFKADMFNTGYSDKYVADMIIMIKSATKFASDVYNYADPFANYQTPKVKRNEAVILSESEQKRFIDYCKKNISLIAICCFTTLFTGLRIGELCALKWDNIDLESKVIHVRGTLQRVKTNGGKSKTAVMLLPPKTSTSVRDIPLPDFLVNVLNDNKQDKDIYFASGNEKPIEPRTLTNRFKGQLEKANVPSVKFHSLRHSFSTNFLRQTGDVKSLSEILGHSSANVTMKIYIHSSIERKIQCMNRLQEII